MWVGYASRPLTVRELEQCVCQRLPEGSRDRIPNFAQTLGTWSGALLELAPDATVQYIHISVLDYLNGLATHSLLQAASPRGDIARQFGHHKPVGHLKLAIYCLDYINNDVDAGPLSGSPQVSPSQELQNRRFPMLNYAVTQWPKHFCEALQSGVGQTNSETEQFFGELLSHLDVFLCSRERVTTWIEASWLLASGPDLCGLSEEMGRVLEMEALVRSQHWQELRDLTDRLQGLAKDLTRLRESWSRVLAASPNEIWEPSIPAFTQSDHWVATRDCKVDTAVVEGQHHDSILIASQVSHDGLELAQLRLFPPR